ncbi:MAG: hypothetical protein ACYDCH_09615 [Gaiellaceae bacterium]
MTPLALTKVEAAAALSMSVDSFERHVQADLRLVRKGRLVLVPVRELERWLEKNAYLTLDDAWHGAGTRPSTSRGFQ